MGRDRGKGREERGDRQVNMCTCQNATTKVCHAAQEGGKGREGLGEKANGG